MSAGAVAIVGMGCRLPGAADLTELARLVRRGEVPVREVPASRWSHASFYDPNPRRLDHTYARRLASVDAIDEFSPEFFGILPRRARAMDPQQRLLLDAARAAIEDAGTRPEALAGGRTGVFVGISVAEHYQLTTARLLATQMKDEGLGRFAPGMAPAWDFLVENVPPLQAYSMVGQMLNMSAASVAQAFDLRGPAFAADSACSSALVALGEAMLHLRAGACDAALVGGVYLAVTPNNMVAFSRIGAISRAEVCRPFDTRADGFVLGEGAGCLLIKRLEDAVAAGDRIWAVVRGFGMNNDGRGEGPMTPRLDGQVAALEAAYRDAGVAPAEVGLVEAHGTATPVGDRIESQALAQVLGSGRTDPCWLTGIKGNIGHTLAAAGAAGLMNAAMALADGVVPPLAGHEQPRGELPLRDAGFVIPRQAADWGARRRIAGVSSFGFGGTNVHVVLEQPPVPAPPRRRAHKEPALPELFLLSAPSEALLVDYARRLADFVAREKPALRDVAFSLSRRRVDPVRAAVVAASREELCAALAAVAPGAPLEGGIALCFPGQGAQAPDLSRDLWQRFPWFRARLEEVAAAAESVVGRRLLDVLYPARDPEHSVELLRRTEICQPALAAVELALAGFLARLGVAGDLAMGHSLGEFVAVAAAGGLAAEDTVRLVAERGRLMAELDGDTGAMAALAIDRAGAERLIDGTGAVLANLNHPRQVVASGASGAIEEVVARAESAGVRATRLPVSHAFHSPVVAPMAAPFGALLEGAAMTAPARRVVSCAGEPAVLDDAAAIRERLARHAVSAIDFEGGVRAAWAAGARAFVQVGAGAALVPMITATLATEGHTATVLAAAPAESTGGAGLLAALAALWNGGVAIAPEALFEGTEARLVALPTSPLATRPFWLLRAPADPAPLPAIGDSPAAGAGEPPAEMMELFRRQLGVIETQLAVLKGHGVFFEGPPTGVEVPAGLTAAAAPRNPEPSPPPVAGPGAADERSVEQKLVEIVARVSALPPASLRVSARLVADLGLDSLMMVELAAAIQEAFGLSEAPAGLVDRDITIAELAARLAEATAAPHRAAPKGAAGPVATRHLATWAPCPLPPAEEPGALPFRGGAVIVSDRGGVAEALAARLAGHGRAAHLIAPDLVAGARWPDGADIIIDVAGKDAAVPIDEAELRAPIDRALALLAAAGRADVRPHYLAASRGARSAALAGFARALALEWPDRLVRAVDAPGGSNGALAGEIAQRIAAELATSDRTPEVSWRSGERRAVRVVPAASSPALPLRGATAVVSGGARGLGAVLARHLARSGAAAKLLLLGRRPADAGVEALLAELSGAGAAARYAACDVGDPAAVALALADARAAFGPFELVVHAAGETADGPVEEATSADVARVFAGKVAGALALWQASASDPIACFLLYGSWAGRFGNRHQTLYAAANRALSGLVPVLAAERPTARVVSIDLPPWPSGGMIERLPEAVRRAMRARGVPFLSDPEGLAAVTAELVAEPGGFEVVLGAGLGGGRRDRLQLTLDPQVPWLADHRVDGAERLPLAAILELAAAAASRVGLAGPLALRDVRVLAPIAGDAALAIDARSAGDEVELEISAGPAPSATCRIEPAAELPPLARPHGGAAPRLAVDEFYRAHTFHGPRMRGIAAVREVGPTHVAGTVLASPSGWPRASDILAIDGALQLAGFFAREQQGRAALPIAIQDARLLAVPPAGAELDCLAVLESADGDTLRGHIDLFGPGGGLVAQIRGLEARVVATTAAAAGANGNGHAHGNGNGHGNENGNGHGHIDPATWRIEEFPEVAELAQRRAMLAAVGLENPYFHLHEGITNQRSRIGGVEFVNYSSYNYVSLSGHPEVNRAVERAVARYGTSVSASRVASGERPLHRQLERAVADFLGCQDAIAMVSGHATNVSVIGHLLDQRDVILHDSLAHDSILGGARLSGARRRPFPHNDADALEHLLGQIRPHARRVLIAVEGVYSMDGDLAPLDRIVELKKRYGALLLVDEAHSLGVVGATGRGIGEHFGIDRADVDLWMGTLSKSLASCGGYIAGSAALVDFLKYTTPGFIYSVGLSPANAAAALAALEILAREPERVATLQARCRFFLERMRERGIDTGMSRGSAVVPCIVPSSLDCLRLAQALHGRGINVQPILYPAVEENQARLRFFVTSGHSEADLVRTADAVREELLAIGPRHLRPVAAPPTPRWEQTP